MISYSTIDFPCNNLLSPSLSVHNLLTYYPRWSWTRRETQNQNNEKLMKVRPSWNLGGDIDPRSRHFHVASKPVRLVRTSRYICGLAQIHRQINFTASRLVCKEIARGMGAQPRAFARSPISTSTHSRGTMGKDNERGVTRLKTDNRSFRLTVQKLLTSLFRDKQRWTFSSLRSFNLPSIPVSILCQPIVFNLNSC